MYLWYSLSTSSAVQWYSFLILDQGFVRLAEMVERCKGVVQLLPGSFLVCSGAVPLVLWYIRASKQPVKYKILKCNMTNCSLLFEENKLIFKYTSDSIVGIKPAFSRK